MIHDTQTCTGAFRAIAREPVFTFIEFKHFFAFLKLTVRYVLTVIIDVNVSF